MHKAILSPSLVLLCLIVSLFLGVLLLLDNSFFSIFPLFLVIATISFFIGRLYFLLCFSILPVLFIILFFCGVYSDPLSSFDSNKYYLQAFGDGYYDATFFEALASGSVPIVQSYAGVIKFLSLLLSSEDPGVIVKFNLVFNFFASAVFSRFTRFRLNLSQREELILFFFLFMSPSLLDSVGVVQKESFVYFLTVCSAVFIALYSQSHKWVLFILSFFCIVILSFIRPYSIAFVLSYLLVWQLVRPSIIAYSSLLFLSIGFVWSGFSYILTVGLSFSALFATPNFFRLSNWEVHSLMTFEAFVFSLYALPLLLIFLYDRNVRNIFYSMVMIACVLALVSVNRLLNDVSYDSSSGLLADDLSRKKIQAIPLIYVAFLLAFRKALSVGGLKITQCKRL